MSKSTQQCTSCQAITKKLKILQADYDFEIKKLNEDKSSQKALYELNMNRQVKKLQDRCQKQKQERVKENESWMEKYDELIQRQKGEMAGYKAQKDGESEQFKKRKEQEVEKFKVETVSKLEERIKSLIEQKQALGIELREEYESRIKSLSTYHDQKVSKLSLKHEQQMRKKCGQYQATITGIQSQKTVEQTLHKRTKQQSRESQARLNQEIYSLKKQIIEHEEKISCLKKEIHEKCHQVQSFKGEIVTKQQLHAQRLEQLAKQYDTKYENHRQSTEKRLQQLLKRQLQNCSKYQKALSKIQQHREIQNQMYKANLNQIKTCVDERPSRCEDVDQIITLRETLLKKQRECDTLADQLKWYRLELENKQQTYNKIFGLQTKNNQSIYIRRKDLKLKRTGKSVTTVREVLSSVNIGNNLAPLVANVERKLLPPKQNKML